MCASAAKAMAREVAGTAMAAVGKAMAATATAEAATEMAKKMEAQLAGVPTREKAEAVREASGLCWKAATVAAAARPPAQWAG